MWKKQTLHHHFILMKYQMLSVSLRYEENTLPCFFVFVFFFLVMPGFIPLFSLTRQEVWKMIFPFFCLLSIVSEAGASIYSVSPEANKEMPGLDPNLRSAGKKLWTITKTCDFDILDSMCGMLNILNIKENLKLHYMHKNWHIRKKVIMEKKRKNIVLF